MDETFFSSLAAATTPEPLIFRPRSSSGHRFSAKLGAVGMGRILFGAGQMSNRKVCHQDRLNARSRTNPVSLRASQEARSLAQISDPHNRLDLQPRVSEESALLSLICRRHDRFHATRAL